jgi:hypothetical protein
LARLFHLVERLHGREARTGAAGGLQLALGFS